MRVAPHVQDQRRGLDDRPPHLRLAVRDHQIMLMLLKGTSPADSLLYPASRHG